MTYEEYKALVATAAKLSVSPYILSDIEAMNALTEQIDAAEAEHPEYEEMLASGI